MSLMEAFMAADVFEFGVLIIALIVGVAYVITSLAIVVNLIGRMIEDYYLDR